MVLAGWITRRPCPKKVFELRIIDKAFMVKAKDEVAVVVSVSKAPLAMKVAVHVRETV